MGLVDELLKLEQLRQRGTLSAAEFERAKLKLLEAEQSLDASDRIAHGLEEANYQAELARIDREWEMERRTFMLFGRRGETYLPSKWGSLLLIVAVVGIGIYWTVSTVSIIGTFHGNLLVLGLVSSFSLFGILFIAVAVFQCLRGISNSHQYQEAQARYQRLRKSLRRNAGK